MPTLVVTSISLPSITQGTATDLRIFMAIAARSSELLTSVNKMANSSPPNRLTVSVTRATLLILSPTIFNSLSPTRCPNVSLITLKRSRSRNMTATLRCSRSEWAIACVRRSCNIMRLGRPVRKSCCAIYTMRSSAALRSLISRITAI